MAGRLASPQVAPPRAQMDRPPPPRAGPPRWPAGIGSKAIGLAERTQNNERLQWSAPSQQTRWQLMDPRRPNAGRSASHHVAARGIRSKAGDLAERSQNVEGFQWQALLVACRGDGRAQLMDRWRPHARAHASHHVAPSGIRSKTVDLAERSQNSERLQWQAPRRRLWRSVGEIAQRSLWTPADLTRAACIAPCRGPRDTIEGWRSGRTKPKC